MTDTSGASMLACATSAVSDVFSRATVLRCSSTAEERNAFWPARRLESSSSPPGGSARRRSRSHAARSSIVFILRPSSRECSMKFRRNVQNARESCHWIAGSGWEACAACSLPHACSKGDFSSAQRSPRFQLNSDSKSMADRLSIRHPSWLNGEKQRCYSTASSSARARAHCLGERLTQTSWKSSWRYLCKR